MKKILSMAFLAVALAFPAAQAQAAENKFAVIDIQKIEAESKAGKDTRAAFAKEVDARKKVLAGKEESIRLLNEQYMKEKETIAPNKRRDLEDRLATEDKELKRIREDYDQELQKKGADIRQKMLQEILAVVKKVVDENKYTVVLDKRQGVIYAADSIDITQKVMDQFNAGYKGGAGK
ncbi:MAG: OmpH family outer membrane protein [Deltaproteobacteria bacterium]|nr:OmpH family outer membrane protein [Deltaproteobacteria bacterium]